MNKQRLELLIPVLGIISYFILFIYSASKYPGGSRIHPEFVGFDWTHNYWCDLMSKKSYNGLVNLSRPSAVLAWIIACLSILFIFLKAVNQFYPFGKWNTIFKTTSFITVIIGILSFTDYHDVVVMVCFPFGAITAIGLTAGLLKSSMTIFKHTVWLCLLFLSVSFFLYFTNIGLQYLGVLQKLTLIITMSWLLGFYNSLFQFNQDPNSFNERI